MFCKKTVKDVDFDGKRVLVRVDFNVPLTESGAVADDTRVRAALPTLRYLVDHGAKVIIMSHLGRPEGHPDDKYRLKPVVRVLSRLLGRNVYYVHDVVGPDVTEAVARMVPGELLIIENVRFHPGEKTNDPDFARELAWLADLYVNDAFGAAHRAHASTVGITEYLPSVGGMLLEREVKTLQGLLEDPERPFVAVLGGSKVSEKLGIIDRLLDCADSILVGGGMCFTFLAAQGIEVGRSILEEDWVDRCREMLDKAKEKGVELMLPVDFIVAREMVDDAETMIVGREEIPADMMGLDIGPTSSELFKGVIAGARTVFWNGPMGVFEIDAFARGTKTVATEIARNSRAVSVVGGGDSDAALRKFDLEERITFVSTGGGASMKLLEGVPLPGVEALEDKE